MIDLIARRIFLSTDDYTINIDTGVVVAHGDDISSIFMKHLEGLEVEETSFVPTLAIKYRRNGKHFTMPLPLDSIGSMALIRAKDIF